MKFQIFTIGTGVTMFGVRKNDVIYGVKMQPNDPLAQVCATFLKANHAKQLSRYDIKENSDVFTDALTPRQRLDCAAVVAEFEEVKANVDVLVVNEMFDTFRGK